MTDLERLKLQEQRSTALQDLAELDDQVTAGEVDAGVADRLRGVYQAEADTADAAISALPSDGAEARRPGSRRRALAGGALLIGAVVLLVVLVIQFVEPRDTGGLVTGGIASDVAAGGATDLSTITNEQLEEVIAANPDVIPMRLALARRYVESGEFSLAVDHYLVVLAAGPEPEALAYVGWISYLSNEPQLAARYLEESLSIAPDYRVAQWFLANVRYEGLGDAAGSIPLLEAIVTDETVPGDVREAAAAMLAAASGVGSPAGDE
jgi:tetratricopeptide (TPR) repeat protein